MSSVLLSQILYRNSSKFLIILNSCQQSLLLLIYQCYLRTHEIYKTSPCGGRVERVHEEDEPRQGKRVKIGPYWWRSQEKKYLFAAPLRINDMVIWNLWKTMENSGKIFWTFLSETGLQPRYSTLWDCFILLSSYVISSSGRMHLV